MRISPSYLVSFILAVLLVLAGISVLAAGIGVNATVLIHVGLGAFCLGLVIAAVTVFFVWTNK